MSSEVYATKPYQRYQKTRRENDKQSPVNVSRFCDDVRSQNTVENRRHHRVSAGEAVTRERQNRIVEMRTRAMKSVLQKFVEQHSAEN